MRTYAVGGGQIIGQVALEMAEQANLFNEPITTEFNFIKITAHPSKDAVIEALRIESYYGVKSAQRDIEFQNSPEGKQATIVAEKLRNHLQNQVTQAMVDLETLDFSNLNAVICWLEKIEKTAHINVVLPSKEILKKFEFHGFEFNVNYGEKSHSIKNVDNFARQIISFALGQIRDHGSIHQSFPRFVERWREKFEFTTT